MEKSQAKKWKKAFFLNWFIDLTPLHLPFLFLPFFKKNPQNSSLSSV